MADIEGYEPRKVDVVYQTSRKKKPLIIVLFHKKSDLRNFYRQKKKKLYSLNVNRFLNGIRNVEDLNKIT